MTETFDSVIVQNSGSAGVRFTPGDLILHRYSVIAVLEKNGALTNYRCIDNESAQKVEVVLKALPLEHSGNTEIQKSINENIRKIKEINHPNIAGLQRLEQDQRSGDLFLVMDRSSGSDLEKWLAAKYEDESLSWSEILAVLKQLVSALRHAHHNKIVHGFLNPDCIVISSAGKVNVMDFSLPVELAEVDSNFDRITGLAACRAPEVWLGNRPDERSDQYSLAVIVYKMLSGSLPFDDQEPVQFRASVLDAQPDEIEGVPENIHNAIMRALSKDPSARFESCSDFFVALSGDKDAFKDDPLKNDMPEKKTALCSREAQDGNKEAKTPGEKTEVAAPEKKISAENTDDDGVKEIQFVPSVVTGEATLKRPRKKIKAKSSPPPPCPPNHLFEAISVTLCCCLPFGIVAIVYACQVNTLYAQGRYLEASRASEKAHNWITVAVVTNLVLLGLKFFARVVMA